MIFGNGPENQDSRIPGVTSKLTSQERLGKPEDHPGPQRPRGYTENVKSAQSNAALFTKMKQDHTLALANLATATQANRKSVVMLTKTIAELSTQVSNLAAKLATAQYKNTCMKKLGHCSAPAEHGKCLSNN